ncbi:MAG: DUF1499 domain-containing protein [Gammaproteobacteria bacterium]|jgi:uncharacterized protein (DUF1499 family)|nr:DUF1499 domain-containing protein [Gammaproteobacteria bacterium]|tara:strand:- start:125 stop:529 length:405 start_codon:yes stop_codon:yes gene_type:complete
MKKSLLALLPFLSACAGEPPQDIGVRDGRLIACPESPNCVSSYESSEEHSIAALDGNLSQIQQILVAMDGANIVKQSSNYLYAEFTSSLMGYVDDVEFLYDAANNTTQVRSASRVGYSDMGANRSRIEAIRTQL